MLNKYNELLEMLKEKYNVSEFCELETEYSAYIDNNNIIVSIYLENEGIEIYIQEKGEEENLAIESKTYKNVKHAYNFIKRYLEDF